MKQEKLLKTILSPCLSEKSVIETEKNNVYVFRVDSSSSKADVADAVQKLFNARVQSVRLLNIKPKKKLFKGVHGSRSAWKKAYVKLFPDQKIDFLSVT